MELKHFSMENSGFPVKFLVSQSVASEKFPKIHLKFPQIQGIFRDTSRCSRSVRTPQIPVFREGLLENLLGLFSVGSPREF